MSEIFGSDYAEAYDLLYRDKDYSEETRLIDRVVKSYTNGPVRRVLDLGCGTGNHVLPLVQLGYEVVGVDRSAGMLEAARKKAAGAALDDERHAERVERRRTRRQREEAGQRIRADRQLRRGELARRKFHARLTPLESTCGRVAFSSSTFGTVPLS